MDKTDAANMFATSYKRIFVLREQLKQTKLAERSSRQLCKSLGVDVTPIINNIHDELDAKAPKEGQENDD